MLRLFAFGFGSLFLLGGAAGFLPEYTTDSKILGIILTNHANCAAYGVIGLVGLFGAISGRLASRLFFLGAAILLGSVALLGFAESKTEILNYFVTNELNNTLYAGLASLFLLFGLFLKR